MSNPLFNRDEVYDSNAITLTLSNRKFSPNTPSGSDISLVPHDEGGDCAHSPSNYEEVLGSGESSEHLSVRKFSKLEPRQSSPKDECEEDKNSRRYSESHLKKRENFRDFVKMTLNLEPSRKAFNGKSCLPGNVVNTIRDRVAETGMEKYADISKKFSSKYQILDYFLGEGSTALVKQCLNKETKKLYAVKIVRSNDTEFLKAIKNEFLIQKHLAHPNIVKAYEMYYNPITSRVKIVMEMVNGCELFELIRENGALSGNFGL